MSTTLLPFWNEITPTVLHLHGVSADTSAWSGVRGDPFPLVFAAALQERLTMACAQSSSGGTRLEEQAAAPAGEMPPCSYAFATADQAIPIDARRLAAQRDGAKTVEDTTPDAAAGLVRRAAAR